MQAAGVAAIPGAFGIIMAGVIYAAQTGVNYRKYRKGKITKEEFKRRAKMGAFGTTCKVVGSTGGLACGFLIGQLIIPIPMVGGFVGAFAGCFAGGIAGRKVSAKVYERIEKKIEARRAEILAERLAQKYVEEEAGLAGINLRAGDTW